MANNFHRTKLCEGALAWNLWRDSNPRIVPDLEDVVLTPSQRQFGLEDWGPIDLRRARLSGSDLRYATLTAADLEEAILARTQFTNARLERANLSRADLTEAVFDEADFSGARLDAAVLDGAQLARARNLTQSQIDRCLGDRATALPPDLAMPPSWLRREARAGGSMHANENGSLSPANANEDPTKKASEEIFKTIARAREALRPPVERKPATAIDTQDPARRLDAQSSHGASSKPSRLAFYLLGTAIAAAAAAMLLWAQLTASAPLATDHPRASVRTGLAARIAHPRVVSPLGPQEAAPPESVEASDTVRPVEAAPAIATVEPRTIETRLLDQELKSGARETPSPTVKVAREAFEETPARSPASLRDVGPAQPSANKPAPSRRVSRPSITRSAKDESSPHPFAPPPCKITRACRAGVAFCGC